MDDDRKHASWVARNREPIWEAIRRVLPSSGRVLEIASGTGEHAAFIAARRPGLIWLPSDRDDDSLRSIRAWRAHTGVDNLLEPVPLDVRDEAWPAGDLDAVVAMNLIHIAPFAVCEALMRGAARVLRDGGVLFLYGPFFQPGVEPPAGNLRFDQDLRERDARWGVRDLGDVGAEAARHGLRLQEAIPMPANNLSVVFGKQHG